MTRDPLHPRAFSVTVAWTLVLLFLGSVVHATESSLACPDWPTCYGTMMPDMEGGVFWEHLHRLVAGGLILMFGLATWLARKEAPERPWLFRVSLAGMALLLVQAAFGGLTVLLRLPDAVSTTHLALALLFLALATVLAAAASPARLRREPIDDHARGRLRLWGGLATGAVFAQSLLGGVVRHMDAGMACPDVPTCVGRWIPPLVHPLITIHFAHRAFGILVALLVVAMAVVVARRAAPHVTRTAFLAVALVVTQVALGYASVALKLAVAPVSLHTLVAATLLTVTTLLAGWGWAGGGATREREDVLEHAGTPGADL